MRATLIAVLLGSVTLPAAAGFWGGESSHKTYPIETVLDRAIPADSCWKVRLSEGLRGVQVPAPDSSLGWKEGLVQLGVDNGFAVISNPDTCVLSVIKGSGPAAAPVAAVASSPMAMHDAAPVSPAPVPVEVATAGPAAGIAETPGYREIGVGAPYRLGSSGMNTPLGDALKRIMPPAFHSQISTPAIEAIPVSWLSGQVWTQALSNMADINNLNVTVDWNRNLVTVTSAMQPISPVYVAPAPSNVIEQAPVNVASYQSVDVQQSVVAEPVNQCGPKPQPSREYKSVSDFLAERVSVDVCQVSLRDALASILPADWSIETREVDARTDRMSIDLTTVNARGAVLNDLMKKLGYAGYPYPEFKKFVVALPR